MPRPKKVVKAKEPVRIRFKELQNGNKSIYLDGKSSVSCPLKPSDSAPLC